MAKIKEETIPIQIPDLKPLGEALEKAFPKKKEIDFDKLIDKEFADMVDLSKVDTKVKNWLDTGIYALNYICSKNLYGGIPTGRITSMDGLTGTGKSLIIASTMKDPKIDKVIVIESEGGGSAIELYKFLGVDVSKIKMAKANTFENYRVRKKDSQIEEVRESDFPKSKETPEFVYVEGVTRIVKRLLNTIQFNNIQKNILIVLDSLGNLQSVRELSGTADMGARSKAIATFFRNFDVSFEKTNVAFMFANKLYTNIGNIYDPFKVAGGVNVEYNPSLSLRLSTTSDTDDVSDKDMKDEKVRRKTALGSSLKTLKAAITKSRFGTEYRTITFLIDFATGPVRYSGLFTLCREFGLITRSGSSYTFKDVFDKSFYKKDFIKMIKENETEVLQKIQEKLAEAETKVLTEKKELEVNDIDEVIEEEGEEFSEEDVADIKKQMVRDVEV